MASRLYSGFKNAHFWSMQYCSSGPSKTAGRRLSGFMAMVGSNRTEHIRLTSHPDPGGKGRFPIEWGAATAKQRGPVIATLTRPSDRNVIGSHGGSYAIYRALAVSSGALDPIR